ncbi:MAG: dienelactone hydrolase family protein [Saprospiraceae bacterium]|nr:dienelactone hydrolase family protein [Saprospiraceae bacterium]MCB0625080.1 dienelactone hydrolase family protein [Saprospiraceae bacterium]MCB0680718.1 dienelactone hydrolase family protein [Saprospiraceae bacterium]
MFKKCLFPLALGLFLLPACNNSSSTEGQDDSMGQFADDENFKDAHQSPDSLGYQGKGQMVEFDTPDGQKGSAYLVTPEAANGSVLFVIHEWWGLNDHIKREADRLAGELSGTTVYALDLYDGKIADNPDQAGQYMQAVQEDRLNAIINGALAQAGPEAKVATIGWCFGGGWSLRSSILAGKQGAGCVMYYGMPVQEAQKLAPLQADVLGLFAKQDDWINQEVVDKFSALAKATGKDLEVHWFDAKHAFANPSQPSYDQSAAQDANALALEFLKARL